MEGEGRDRRCITVSIGVGSRYLIAESSGQRLELRKKTITDEAHFDKTEYWMLNFLSCLPHTKKTIYTPLALLYALLCFIINGISWKRKQKRVLKYSSVQVRKDPWIKAPTEQFYSVSLHLKWVYSQTPTTLLLLFFNFSHLPASICDNLAWGQG